MLLVLVIIMKVYFFSYFCILASLVLTTEVVIANEKIYIRID